jgi:hypothetical protein
MQVQRRRRRSSRPREGRLLPLGSPRIYRCCRAPGASSCVGMQWVRVAMLLSALNTIRLQVPFQSGVERQFWAPRLRRGWKRVIQHVQLRPEAEGNAPVWRRLPLLRGWPRASSAASGGHSFLHHDCGRVPAKDCARRDTPVTQATLASVFSAAMVKMQLKFLWWFRNPSVLHTYKHAYYSRRGTMRTEGGVISYLYNRGSDPEAREPHIATVKPCLLCVLVSTVSSHCIQPPDPEALHYLLLPA